MMKNLNKLLQCIPYQSYSHKNFVEGFNFRHINWESQTTFHNENSKEAKFNETIRDCYLHQHNQRNSRIRSDDEHFLIDLIFMDEAMQISDIAHHTPVGKSDHNVITFKFNCYLGYLKPKDRYLYNKADF